MPGSSRASTSAGYLNTRAERLPLKTSDLNPKTRVPLGTRDILSMRLDGVNGRYQSFILAHRASFEVEIDERPSVLGRR